ncbi:DNA methyltransferase [Actinoplanes solisilvae]|uniref:DNA methyltransferase n=1 Tax=Actinoplanes solisilvae TaxID=2486853 RepID=UPI00196ABC8E|nr:DNA methyltransferase [Actinoplanes solisilvae]
MGRNSTTFGGNLALPVHRWFRYSAGFAADWVAAEVGRRGARRVLDPFAGSGTTLLAAQAVGAEAAGVELHPFVARVARAKLLWTADEAAFRARALQVASDSLALRPDLPQAGGLTARCFPAETLGPLLALRDAIDHHRRGDDVDELLWLALVGILRRCSPVGTAQWQYVLPGRTKARVALAGDAFREQVDMMGQDMSSLRLSQPSPPRARLSESDVRQPFPVGEDWADLVITSPPYANNYDYADCARLEMTFLGDIGSWSDLNPLRRRLVRSSTQQMARYDGETVLRTSPGLSPIRDELAAVYANLAEVRRTRGGRKVYHSMIVAYFDDMATAWHQIRRSTAPGGQVCFVVGDSAPYGVHVPVERWLGILAVAAGFHSWHFEKVRTRNDRWENRKHRVPLHEGRLWVSG